MQTQAKVQLDERDKNPGVVRPPFNPLQVLLQQPETLLGALRDTLD